ncbi:hypothetical protein WMY93_024399 [Mugilogobius chulae]|uniref:Uncharacterized protein n=1 Tax=Mugilogobius chulae TaxID=88201 RepID=A0AAW0NBE8_9GOBI
MVTGAYPSGRLVGITLDCGQCVTVQELTQTAEMEALIGLEWLDYKSILVFLFLFALFTNIIQNWRPKNYPPGPWPIPFIGDTFRVSPSTIHLDIAKLAKKYGNIFSVQLFGGKVVVINGYKLVREALAVNGDDYVDRPKLPLFEDLVGNAGLVLSNGYLWKQQRRFALHTLRNFGLGKKSLEPAIQQECQYLTEALALHKGEPIDPHILLNKAVSNIIPEILEVQGTIWAMLYNTIPGLMRRLPGPHRRIFTLSHRVVGYVQAKIDEHKESHNPSDPRDYIDCFLSEIAEKEDKEAGFDMRNLCFSALDLFGAGSETTTSTLYWGLLFMINYPDIQKRVQAEIDAVVGSSRPPSMQDRDDLHYTNAGVMIVGNLDSVLHDPSMWESPHTFNPGHFLDENGKFCKREDFIPFSIDIYTTVIENANAKREREREREAVCLGEQLARMELFLFFSGLLQRFTFSAPEGEKPTLDSIMTVMNAPKPYRLCAKLR